MTMFWDDLGSSIYANPELSDEARIISAKSSRFYDLTSPGGDLALGKKHGSKVGYKLWGRISGVGTTPLSENVKVPMTSMPEYEGTATVYQYGLGIPWTGVREDLDRLSVEEPVVFGLKEHSSRTHNKLIYDALVAGRSFCYSATTNGTLTTNGSPSGTAATAFSAFHARNIYHELTKRATPFFDGENYVGVISPTMKKDFFNDSTAVTGYVDVLKYTSKADGLINGEFGSYFNLRMAVDNDVLSGSLDAIGSGSAFGSGIFAGLDAAREIVVYPMQLLANLNLGGDFGRQKAIAWLSMLTYKTVWNYTSHGQGTVLHYTTA